MKNKMKLLIIFLILLNSIYLNASKIYFKNTKAWKNVNVYIYTHTPELNEISGQWPGNKMNKDNGNWYYYEFEGNDKYSVIFNDGERNQFPQVGVDKEVAGDVWCDANRWFNENPKYLALPEINVEPAGGVFSNDSIDVMIEAGNDSEIKYRIDRGSWKKLNAGLLNIELEKGKETRLTVKADNFSGSAVSEYLFEKGMVPIPIIKTIPAGGSTEENVLLVDLQIEGFADKARYAIDNEPWIQFKTKCTIVLDMEKLKNNESKIIKVYAENTSGVSEDTFTYVKKKEIKKDLRIHFKNVDNWENVNIYTYGEGAFSYNYTAQWPGEKMENEGNSWFGYTIPGNQNTFIVFTDGKGNSFPKDGAYLKNKEEWFNGYFWSEYNLNNEFSVNVSEKESERYGDKKIEFNINGEYQEAKYTINGENPKTKGISFINGQNLSLKLPESGEELFLRVYARNGKEEIRKDYRYKIEPLIRDVSNLKIYTIPLEIFQGEIFTSEDIKSLSKIKQIEKSLNYINKLGINAIAINPFYNRKNKTLIKDHYSINSSYGTDEELKQLIKKAHSYGLYVFFTYDFLEIDKKIIEKGSGERTAVLNKFYFEKNIVIDFYKDIFSYWVDEYEIDGWDFYNTKDAGEKLINSINDYIKKIGEKRREEGKYWGIYSYISVDFYKEEIKADSVQDNEFRSLLLEKLAKDDNLANNFKIKKGQIKKIYMNNDNTVRLGDLIQRAGYEGQEYIKRYKAALALFFSKSGVLNIYYGDEIGAETDKFIFNGDNGILDDEVFKYYQKNNKISYEEQNLKSYLQSLIKIRSEHSAIEKGEEIVILNNKDIYATLKTKNDSRILFVLNSGNNVSVAEIEADLIGGYTLIDLETSQTIEAYNGQHNIIVEEFQGKFYLVK